MWPEQLPEDRTVSDVIEELASLAVEAPRLFARTDILELEFLQLRPDSLLLRLVIRSLQVALGDVGRELLGDPPPGLEPIVRLEQDTGRLQGWIEGNSSDALHGATPQAVRFQRTAEALLEVA